ncbi:MAG: cytidylate kinase-like family protein [Acetatifactor sp.]|nr:cytidylate kinase-like family protein [Acetatifactor sp.]
MDGYVVTIARGYGSGGSHIAHKLCNELGIKYFDSEILDRAAEMSSINEHYFYEANEKIKKGVLSLNTRKGHYTGNLYSADDKQYLSNENLFNYQAKVIKEIALGKKESCVIIGKAANRIIGSLKNVVSVNIQAPLPYCINNISERLMVNKNEAKELILKTDQYRMDYYKYYTGGKWDDPKEYNLSINTADCGEDYAVKIIIDYLKHKNVIS